MFKNLSLKFKLSILFGGPMILMTILIVAFGLMTNNLIDKITIINTQKLESTQLVLNADRDIYQALDALQGFSFNKQLDKQEAINTYKENSDQVSERLEKAKNILAANSSVWNKYIHKDTHTNLFEEFEAMSNDFSKWKELANGVFSNSLSFDKQASQFDVTREHINVITEILETGSVAELAILNKAKNEFYFVIASLCLASFLIISLVAVAIQRSILIPIRFLANISLQLAENNLAVEIPDDDTKTEIGELNRAYKKFVNNLKKLVLQVVQSVDEVSANSEEVNASAEQTALGSQQIATNITQLASGTNNVATHVVQLSNRVQQISKGVSELTEGVHQISKNIDDGANHISKINKAIQNVSSEAARVAKLGNETEYKANAGSSHVKKAVDKIDSIRTVSSEISVTISDLGRLSSEIETIVDLIKNISTQTNLLALNAAIEAARAGEHGKGFAVVADEVKKLATQSGEATDNITSMIKEIQNKTNVAVSTMDRGINEVNEGVVVINNAGTALEEIIDQVKSANGNIQIINKEIDAVAVDSDLIVKMIEDISGITDETAASGEKIFAIAKQTSESIDEIASITEESAASSEEISSVAQEQTASMEEISASSHSLAKIAGDLQEQVAVFKL